MEKLAALIQSKNLEIDDIKNIFTREYILKLLDNLL